MGWPLQVYAGPRAGDFDNVLCGASPFTIFRFGITCHLFSEIISDLTLYLSFFLC